MKFDITAPCVAARPFAGYREGDAISPTSYWRLRRWARRGWVKNAPAGAIIEPDATVKEEDSLPAVTATGGGWYTVTDGDETLRFQGRSALEEAGYEAPDG